MTSAESPWPIRTNTSGPTAVSVGTVLWRARGAEQARLTIIVKASFSLVREAAMTPVEPDPLVLVDSHHHGDPRFSLEAASEIAPYRAQAEVLLSGHAYAPPGRPSPYGGVRLIVHRGDQAFVRKNLNVQGDTLVDAHGRTSDPVPFQYMPLLYERAAYHPEDNPVGLDPRSGRLPNLTSADDPQRIGVFGPIAAHWPTRARFLYGLDPRLLVGTRLELPQQFDFQFFLTSPRDQRTDFFHGNEQLLLGGLHPVLPMLRTRFPGVRAKARVFRSPSSYEPVDLWADTLHIETDKQRATLIFRSNIGVADSELASLVVYAGAELPDAALVFPETLPTSRPVPAPKAPAAHADRETKAFSVEELLQGPSKETLPFASTAFAVRLPLPPSVTAAPATASAAPPSTPPPAPPRATTFVPDGEGTMVGSIESLRQALPFAQSDAPPVLAEPPPVSAPIADKPKPKTDKRTFVGTIEPPKEALPFAGASEVPPPSATPPRVEATPFASTAYSFSPAEPPPSIPSAVAPPAAVALPPMVGAMPPPVVAPPMQPIAPPGLAGTTIRPEARPSESSPPPSIPRRRSDTIPVFGTTRFVLVTMPWQLRPPQDSLTVVVKGTCSIVPDGPAEFLAEPNLPLGDTYVDDDLEKSLVYPSDLAVFKAKADVVLFGHAHAPKGKSQAAEVTWRFGRGKASFYRRAAVFGERQWEKSLVTLAPTNPRSFTSLPMRWENAFGGPKFDKNPAGVGHKAAAGADGVPRLPHFENPDQLIHGPGDSPDPVCFGAISPQWKDRATFVGTYDGEWLAERWPYFPKDFDGSFFQHAPRSQQLDYLEGDEPFEITGMHPKLALIRGTLPGVRPRCFLQRTEEAGGLFEEVVLRLDSVVFDVEAMKIDLVYRGVVEVSDEDAPEVAAFYLTADTAPGKRPSLDEARQGFYAALVPTEPIEETPEDDVEPVNETEPEAPDDPVLVAMEAAALAREKAIRDSMKEAGLEEPAPTPLESTSDPQKLAQIMREAGASPADVAAMLETLQPEPPDEPDKPLEELRRQVEALLAAGENLEGLELENGDLSDLDFSQRSLVGTSFRGTNLRGCKFVRADLTGVLFSGADLTMAVLDEAVLETADLVGACVEDASFQRATLTEADFSEARGSRALFQQSRGQAVLFIEGTWTKARFDGADLPSADFTAAKIDAAVFAGANLADITLYDVEGDGASFDGARMPDARVDGAVLLRANFRNVGAPSSIWERAKLDNATFIGATLPTATFVRASCVKTNFSGADLTEAVLRRAKLPGAQFFKANLMQASFERADLSNADLRGANLHAASLWKARMRGADTDFAILTKTTRKGAS